MTDKVTYDKNNVVRLTSKKDWKTYKKKVTTKAVRIDKPFGVSTSEGLMHCEDGYLAMDARGYPYPIAKEEFDLIYEEVGGEK